MKTMTNLILTCLLVAAAAAHAEDGSDRARQTHDQARGQQQTQLQTAQH